MWTTVTFLLQTLFLIFLIFEWLTGGPVIKKSTTGQLVTTPTTKTDGLHEPDITFSIFSNFFHSHTLTAAQMSFHCKELIDLSKAWNPPL